jgi:hypothetical protein
VGVPVGTAPAPSLLESAPAAWSWANACPLLEAPTPSSAASPSSSVLAITRTNDLIAATASPVVALDAGYHWALLAGSMLMAAAAPIALQISNIRGAAPVALADADTPPQPAPSQTRSSRTPVRGR